MAKKKSELEDVYIGNRPIGPGKPCFIIAEAGSNHNGDLRMAKRLVRAAAKAGADAIKFQLFTPELSNNSEVKNILKRYMFKKEWLETLLQYALDQEILFLATPFDKEAVDLLESIAVPVHKVSSGDVTYHSLLAYVARIKKPIFLSVGMATDSEIATALKIMNSAGADKKIVLLHCVSSYPAKPEDAFLERIKQLRKNFRIPVGYSDHTIGIHISLSSIAYGACVIEKHFTLDRKQEGPDHSFAIEPGELRDLVSLVGDIEKARGENLSMPLACERLGLEFGRRSVYAARNIPAGAPIREQDIKVVRPVEGIPADQYDRILGKKAILAIKSGEALTWEKLA